MQRLGPRFPRWLLRAGAAVAAVWCIVGMAALMPTAGGVRRVRPLAHFTHDPSAGAIPWRVVLHDHAAETVAAQGQIEAILAWRRRSHVGLGLPFYKRREEFVLRGDAPRGAQPLSSEDAISLMMAAYAALPADADRAQLDDRNAFLLGTAPEGVLDHLDVGTVAFTLSMPVALALATLSLLELRRQSRAVPAGAFGRPPAEPE